MDPKIIVIIAVSYLYGFFEVSMNLWQRRKNNATTTNDKGSLWLFFWMAVLFVISSVGLGLLSLPYHKHSARLNNFPTFLLCSA